MAEYLTVPELATQAGVSTGYIRRLILDGKLKADKRGRDLFISDAEARQRLAVPVVHGAQSKQAAQGLRPA